ncbi:MAG: ligand-binding protein SH3 [Symbiobacterium thermophilum]|uniref:Ligand-binding protein SH3 n=1 Tax=Symbiobacterium thermophilum TaxID=2734 RepID=A0A953I998_SYMTR|nr:ligand-binding protein SH3 [Symbiobacterium thermophilum]
MVFVTRLRRADTANPGGFLVFNWSAALKVMAISAIPFLELRFGIPVGIVSGLDPAVAVALGVLGNVLQVPLIIFIMYMLRRIAQQVPWAARILARIDRAAERHEAKVRRYGWLGLALLIGIPIPGTGLWTGAAVANLMRMPLMLTALSMAAGVAIAGVLVGAVTTGAIAVIDLF